MPPRPIVLHPRFLVPRLGRAVNPYCLLFRAFVPAASVGLRLLSAGRASFRGALPLCPFRLALPTGFAPFAWPFRLLHDPDVAFPLPAPFELPPGRLPFPEACPLPWLPFRAPFDALPAPPFHRAPAAARPSEPECLAVPRLEVGFSGLRSRE